MSENDTSEPTQTAQKPTFNLGGQALIEGVMMRSPHFIAASVRRSNGEIETRVERFHSVLEKSKLFRLPFVRGVIALIEMMAVGSRFLRWSSDLIMQDEAAKNEAAKNAVSAESSTRFHETNSAAISHDDAAK